MEQNKQFFTVGDVAEWLSIHTKTVHKAIKLNHLHAYKIGSDYRIAREDVIEWLNRKQNYIKETKPCQTN